MDFYVLFLIRTIIACLLHLSQGCPSCRPKNWPGNWYHGKVVLQWVPCFKCSKTVRKSEHWQTVFAICNMDFVAGSMSTRKEFPL